MHAEMKKEATKLALTIIVFATVLVANVCYAQSADRRGPLCGWRQVRVDSANEPMFELLVASAVRDWEKILGRRVMGHSGRWPSRISYAEVWEHSTPHHVFVGIADDETIALWDKREIKTGVKRSGYTVWWSKEDGRCNTGAVIWIRVQCVVHEYDPSRPECRTVGHIYKVIMHELGHALGLYESLHPGSLMFESIGEDDTRIWLGPDSRAWLRNHYGAEL